MTTLAADKPRVLEIGDLNDIAVIASDIIYEGAAVGDNGSGLARPLVAGDIFLGFATKKADNSAGAASAITVNVQQRGRMQLPIGSLAATDLGKPIYASDDDTFTLTPGSNSHIGRCIRFVSSGVGIVEFDASRGGAGEVTQFSVSVGTASDTIPDVGAAFNQTTLNNIVRSLADKINILLGMQK